MTPIKKRTLARLRRLAKQQGRPATTTEDLLRLVDYITSVAYELPPDKGLDDIVNGIVDAFYAVQTRLTPSS